MEFVRGACRCLTVQIDQFGDWILPALFKLSERTNKVFIQRAQQALNEYIKVAPIPRTLIPRFNEAMKSSNKGLRGISSEALEAFILACSDEALTDTSEPLEKLLTDGMSDASPQVRESCRRSYFIISTRLPSLCRRY